MATLNANLARRHETLVVRVDAFLRQVEPIARKAPAGAVPAGVRATAEALLFEAQPFTPGPVVRHRDRDLPPARPSWAELATQAGQLRAHMDAFETAHSRWHTTLRAFCWQVGGDEPLPVARLRKDIAGPVPTPIEARRAEAHLPKVYARIDEWIREGYAKGFEDALAGRPPDPRAVTLAGRRANGTYRRQLDPA